MVIERPGTMRSGGAGEIECPQPSALSGEPTTFTTFGLVFPLVFNLDGQRCDVDRRRPAGAKLHWIVCGSIVGRSPCTLITISASPSGSTLVSASKIRSEPDWMVGPGHHHLEACSGHRIEHLAIIDGHDDSADIRLLSPFCDLHDHRKAGDIASGLPGSRVDAMRAGSGLGFGVIAFIHRRNPFKSPHRSVK